MTPDQYIEALVKDLAHARQLEADARKHLDEMRERFEKTTDWLQWYACMSDARQAVSTTLDELRAAAVDAYDKSQDKHPHPAVSIRLNTRLQYDPDRARVWCSDHLPRAMILDVRLFEKHAKAVAETYPLEFVEIVQEPAVVISTDLSEYLPEQVEAK